MQKLRVAVIGVGYLGRFHAQKYAQAAGCELVAVVDARAEAREAVAQELSTRALGDYREWSYRLAGPAFAPLAERFFLALSHRRRRLAFLFEPKCQDGSCSLGR